MTLAIQPKRRRAGRPPKLDCERNKWRVQPGFTDAEFDELELKAESAGLSLADYVKTAALGRGLKTVPKINVKTYVELGRVGNNANQIARSLNSSEDVDAQYLKFVLTELVLTIGQLRQEVLGVDGLPNDSQH